MVMAETRSSPAGTLAAQAATFLSAFCSLCLAQLRNDVGVEKKHQDSSCGRERLPTSTARFTHDIVDARHGEPVGR